MRVLTQAGANLGRLLPSLVAGSHISDTFKLRHPYIDFDFDKMVMEADSVFLLKALGTGLELKGQMVKTTMGPKTVSTLAARLPGLMRVAGGLPQGVVRGGGMGGRAGVEHHPRPCGGVRGAAGACGHMLQPATAHPLQPVRCRGAAGRAVRR